MGELRASFGVSHPTKLCPPGRLGRRSVICRTAYSTDVPVHVTEANASKREEVASRFSIADLNSDGHIARDEFGRLVESLSKGREYLMFSWLQDSDIDAAFARFVDKNCEALTLSGFERMLENKLLLPGSLSEYRRLFESCPTFCSEGGMFGSVSWDDIVALAGIASNPLCQEHAAALLSVVCQHRACDIAARRVGLQDFLALFWHGMLDLEGILAAQDARAAALPEYSSEEVDAARALLPEEVNGLYFVTAREQVEAMQTVNPNKVVLLLAGVSWCRPCKTLTKPLEKLAAAYAEGAIFMKVFGDQNDNTKRYFRNVLNVTATPAVFAWRKGTLVYERRGGNKAKIEGAVRRFYDAEAYAMPGKPLFLPRVQDYPIQPAALLAAAFPS